LTRYFKQLLSSQNKESVIFEKKVTIPNKALKASYKMAELIVENKKPHTIGESLILPACSEIVRIMFGSVAEAEIKKIHLSGHGLRYTFNRGLDSEHFFIILNRLSFNHNNK